MKTAAVIGFCIGILFNFYWILHKQDQIIELLKEDQFNNCYDACIDQTDGERVQCIQECEKITCSTK